MTADAPPPPLQIPVSPLSPDFMVCAIVPIRRAPEKTGFNKDFKLEGFKKYNIRILYVIIIQMQ